jgi:hypothetical protein
MLSCHQMEEWDFESKATAVSNSQWVNQIKFRGSKTVKRVTLNSVSSGLQVLSSWFQRRKDLIVKRNRCIDMTLMDMPVRLNAW